MLLIYRKETNIVCFPYIIGCVYCKNQVFLWFTNNSQSKLKKIQHTVLEISSKKNTLRNLARFRGGLFELEVLAILQALHSALLKNETKNFSQMQEGATQLKIA